MNMKDKILESAFLLFLENGFSSVSIADIKQKSEISSGTFYYYFESKNKLIDEVMQEYVISFFYQVLDSSKNYEGTSKEKLTFLTKQIMGIDQEDKIELYKNSTMGDYRRLHLLYLEGVQKYELMANVYHDFILNLRDFIKNIIIKGKKTSEIREDVDVQKITTVIESRLLGDLMLWIAVPEMNYDDFNSINSYDIWSLIENN